jgi:Hypothetical glycosyl hydrolase family 15
MRVVRFAVACTVALAATSGAGPASAATSLSRYPSTAGGIHLYFGMQGRMSTTRAQAVRAAAAGDMITGLPVQLTRFGPAMVAANPSVRMFAYVNGMFSQSKDCATYPDSWYLHDSSGAKVRAVHTGNCLMNPLSTEPFGGANGWTAHVAAQCSDDIATTPATGCFFDQMNAAPLGSGFVTGAPVDPSTGAPFARAAYMQLVTDHARALQSAVGAPTIGNSYDSAPRFYGIPTRVVDASPIGVFEAEHWFGNDPLRSRVPSAWRQAVQMMIDAQLAGHGVIVNFDGPGNHTRMWRRYVTASFLLGDRGHAWLEFAPDSRTAPFDSIAPFYRMPIGRPVVQHATVAGYRHGGVYRRAFTHGLVLVNPGARSIRVGLRGTYRGVRGRPLRSVVMTPHSGRVLRR